MSYDLHVYTPDVGHDVDLAALVAAAGLAREGDGETVVRGAERRYCFTLARPLAVEPEDVPEEVTAVLLDARLLWELHVEGSTVPEVPHAVRFARRLATAGGGVVLDLQTGQTWHRGVLRTPPPVSRGLIDIVDLRWYVAASSQPAAESWLELARRHLPEALPRRFGTYEPLQGRLDRDGPEAFVGADDGRHSTYFDASAPCLSGSLASSSTLGAHSLSVQRTALADQRWANALRSFFVAVAVRTHAVYAVAEVVRGLSWSGRGIAYGPEAESRTYLAARGVWAGLPPHPVWWSWFGAEYLPLVADQLPAGQLSHVDGGMLHEAAPGPLDRDELRALLPRSLRRVSERLHRIPARAAPWLPADLLPVIGPDHYVLRPARRMPASLVRRVIGPDGELVPSTALPDPTPA